MFSLICVWINDWVNNREAGDLRRHRGHYDVTVMLCHLKRKKTQGSLYAFIVMFFIHDATCLKYQNYNYLYICVCVSDHGGATLLLQYPNVTQYANITSVFCCDLDSQSFQLSWILCISILFKSSLYPSYSYSNPLTYLHINKNDNIFHVQNMKFRNTTTPHNTTQHSTTHTNTTWKGNIIQNQRCKNTAQECISMHVTAAII